MGAWLMQPAPGQPGSDQLPFMAAFGNPELADCHCLGWPWNRGGHTRECLADRADEQRAHELARALLPEDIRWLNDQGWDGRFRQPSVVSGPRWWWRYSWVLGMSAALVVIFGLPLLFGLRP